MNKVLIVGRLASDARIYKRENGTLTAFYTIAVNYNKDRVDFIEVQQYFNKASKLLTYLRKGTLISVEGHFNTYKDKDNHTQQVVAIDRVELLSSKKKNSDDDGDTGSGSQGAMLTPDDIEVETTSDIVVEDSVEDPIF